MSAPDAAGALAALLRPGRHGALDAEPVRIAVLARDVVQVSARRGRLDDLAAGLRAGLGLVLPAPGRVAYAAGTAALWLQPNAWMLCAPSAGEGNLARAAKTAAGDAGSVVDQTHGRTVFALAGARARDVLARICRLDLHPRVFAPAQVAATRLADMPGLIHQLDALPSYELVVFSTYAVHFAGALTHAAEGVGYEIA